MAVGQEFKHWDGVGCALGTGVTTPQSIIFQEYSSTNELKHANKRNVSLSINWESILEFHLHSVCLSVPKCDTGATYNSPNDEIVRRQISDKYHLLVWIVQIYAWCLHGRNRPSCRHRLEWVTFLPRNVGHAGDVSQIFPSEYQAGAKIKLFSHLPK